jgi:hypothetical protein
MLIIINLSNSIIRCRTWRVWDRLDRFSKDLAVILLRTPGGSVSFWPRLHRTTPPPRYHSHRYAAAFCHPSISCTSPPPLPPLRHAQHRTTPSQYHRRGYRRAASPRHRHDAPPSQLHAHHHVHRHHHHLPPLPTRCRPLPPPPLVLCACRDFGNRNCTS